MQEFWRAFLLAKNQWGRRIVVGILMIVDSVSLILIPLIFRMLFDLLTPDNTLEMVVDQLNRGVFYLVVLAILRFGVIYGQIYLQEGTGNYISHDIRRMLFHKLMYLPFAYFGKTKTGDLMSVMTRDVDAVRDGTGFVVMLVIVNILTTVGIVIAMVRLDPLFALIVLGSFPFLAAIALLYSKIVKPMYTAVQDRSGRLHAVAQENVSGIRVVKAFVRHQEEERRFSHENTGLYSSNLRIAFLNSLVHPSLDFLGGAASLIALGVGGVFVIQGTMTIGTLVAFTNFAEFLVWPIRQIGWLAEMLQRATAGAKRIYQVVDEKTRLEERDQPTAQPIRGDITFDNVRFAYPDGDGEEAIAGFNLHVAAGQKVCLLGMTGSGKTTVANLLPRFYDVSEGAISIDGIDVRRWDLGNLRSQIGFVFQDNFLFSASLGDNLTMGHQQVSPEEIDQAVTTAQAAAFIDRLPKRYETVVGERGIGLSGGERQRVAIARALLRDPRILIFDDSTSSLDVKTEVALKQAVENLFAGRTVVIIAQRVSTAMSADVILVLESGRVVERGTHAALLAKKGIYHRLHELQSMHTAWDNQEVKTHG